VFFVLRRGVRGGAFAMSVRRGEDGFLVFVSVCFCFFCKKVIILQVDKVGT
jgi:hypothetical protein